MGASHCYYKSAYLGINVVPYIQLLKDSQTKYWIFQETFEASFHLDKYLVIWEFELDRSGK